MIVQCVTALAASGCPDSGSQDYYKSGRFKTGRVYAFSLVEKAFFLPPAYSYIFFFWFLNIEDWYCATDWPLPTPQCLQSAPFLPPQKCRPAWRPRNMTCCSDRGWWTCGRMASRKGQLGRSSTCPNPLCTASSSSIASATRWRTCHATDGPKSLELKEREGERDCRMWGVERL